MNDWLTSTNIKIIENIIEIKIKIKIKIKKYKMKYTKPNNIMQKKTWVNAKINPQNK